MKKTTKIIVSLLLTLSLVSGATGVSFATGAFSGNSSMNVGVGKADITGPITKISTGYNSLGDLMSGLLTRLYARAFIIEEDGCAPVVYCSAELVHMTESIKPAVIKELAARGLSQYKEENVMLSATHCHSSTSNTSWYALYDLINGVPGYDDDSYKLIVKGIADAIEVADKNLAPGKIVLSYGNTNIESANRSVEAAKWNKNYKDVYTNDIEAALSSANANKEMQVLRFMHGDQDIGMLSFFASHGTSNTMDNTLVASDHKGYACLFVENAMGGDYVAANCQAASGDVSPNLPDPTASDIKDPFLRPYDRMKNLDEIENQIYAGQQEANAMLQLIKGGAGVTTMELTGPVSYNYSTVDFSNIAVDEKYIGDFHMDYDDIANAKTSEPCIGAGIIAGDEEGAPVNNASEGAVRHNFYIDENGNVVREPVDFSKTISLYGLQYIMGPIWPTAMKLLQSDAYDEAQAEKVVCLAVGKLMQKNQPLQILRIGQLAIAGVSFEITNEQGKRTVAQLEDTLSNIGIQKVILSTHSNAYSQYVTTREEYAAQHYEGATNLFGPWTGAAITQELDRLATDMVNGVASDKGPGLRDTKPLILLETPASLLNPIGERRGSVGTLVTDTEKTYKNDQWVKATFTGANPRHIAKLTLAGNPLIKDYSYMEVQKLVNGNWVTIKTDTDPYTTFSYDTKSNEATVGWLLRGVEDGTYRLAYNYVTKELTGVYSNGTVYSSEFTIGKAESSTPIINEDKVDQIIDVIGQDNLVDVIDKIQNDDWNEVIGTIGQDGIDKIKDIVGADSNKDIKDILEKLFGVADDKKPADDKTPTQSGTLGTASKDSTQTETEELVNSVVQDGIVIDDNAPLAGAPGGIDLGADTEVIANTGESILPTVIALAVSAGSALGAAYLGIKKH